MTTDPTLMALRRLNMRLGRERGRFERLREGYFRTSAERSPEGMRAYGEAEAMRLAQGFVEAEIRRAKKGTP